MTKTQDAAARLAQGNSTLPSPEQVRIADRTGSGGWSAMQLAEWGVAWPPKRGWRQDLEVRWRLARRVSQSSCPGSAAASDHIGDVNEIASDRNGAKKSG